MVSWHWLAGHAVFLTYPATEIQQLATLRAKGTIGIVFPLDRLTADRTLHTGECSSKTNPSSGPSPV